MLAKFIAQFDQEHLEKNPDKIKRTAEYFPGIVLEKTQQSYSKGLQVLSEENGPIFGKQWIISGTKFSNSCFPIVLFFLFMSVFWFEKFYPFLFDAFFVTTVLNNCSYWLCWRLYIYSIQLLLKCANKIRVIWLILLNSGFVIFGWNLNIYSVNFWMYLTKL